MAEEEIDCGKAGGEWLSGITPLSSFCALKYGNELPPTPPTVLDVLAQYTKEPFLDRRDEDPRPMELLKSYGSRLSFQDPQQLEDKPRSMSGIGPRGASVTWPVVPGNLIWSSKDIHYDTIRRFGVYIGGDMVVDMGQGVRAVSPREGLVYWKPFVVKDEDERVKVTDISEFTNSGRMRCGLMAPSRFFTEQKQENSLSDVIDLAVASVGVKTRRLMRPDSHHFAIYVKTGKWIVDSSAYSRPRHVHPTYFKGEFYNNTHVEESAKTLKFTDSDCVIQPAEMEHPGAIPAPEGSLISLECPGFVAIFHTIPFTEELIRQYELAEPFHEPFSNTFLAEDQVADILASAEDFKNKYGQIV